MDVMMRRRELMMLGGGLPGTYRRVEYLESSGTQWIDTGITPTPQTKVRFKLKNLERTGDVIFGFRNAEYTSWRIFNASWTFFDLPSGDGSTYRLVNTSDACKIAPDTVTELEFSNHYIKNLSTGDVFDGTYVSAFTDFGNKTLALNYDDATHISKNAWYYVKIYDGATLVRNFIPCVRKSDSKPGMYDTVSHTFYTNAGTGEFVVPN